MLVCWRMSNGSLFHVRGPATEIAQSPIVVHISEYQTSDCRQIGDFSGLPDLPDWFFGPQISIQYKLMLCRVSAYKNVHPSVCNCIQLRVHSWLAKVQLSTALPSTVIWLLFMHHITLKSRVKNTDRCTLGGQWQSQPAWIVDRSVMQHTS